jgi:putative oxidoreductase
LLTRPAAFLILCVMLTAFFGVHINDPFAKQESALMYGFIALAFLIVGSGRYGLDSLIRGGRNTSRGR